MEVDVYQAVLTIEGKKKVLNKAMAKQFPVRPLSTRDGRLGEVKEPLAKIQGEMLGHVARWLYLVEDEEAGLAWEPAALYNEVYGAEMRERGCNVDDPSQVPTVIL